MVDYERVKLNQDDIYRPLKNKNNKYITTHCQQ